MGNLYTLNLSYDHFWGLSSHTQPIMVKGKLGVKPILVLKYGVFPPYIFDNNNRPFAARLLTKPNLVRFHQALESHGLRQLSTIKHSLYSDC